MSLENSVASVTLPYRYIPRPYQVSAWWALAAGAKRIVRVNHRRSGKDLDTWNQTIVSAATSPKIHYYLFPTFAQGRKVIWEGMDKEGRPFLDYVPQELVDGHMKDHEMQIRVKTRLNGKKAWSIIQIAGTDNYDKLMGTNPQHLVLSEYPLQDPLAWEYFKPILAENGGTAIFCYTPRGKNHGWDLYENALTQIHTHGSKEWYLERLTVEDTWYVDRDAKSPTYNKRRPVVSMDRIEQERREGTPEEMIQQEYLCSFNAGMAGSYYSDLMDKMESEGRVGDFPWRAESPVMTFWDIGVTDDTAILFVQEQNGVPVVIDYLEHRGEGVSYYAKELQKKNYVYKRHVGPHDLKKSEYGPGMTIAESAYQLGLKFEILQKTTIQDGVNAVRLMLTKCKMDRRKTDRLRKALKQYHREFDESTKSFKASPARDWSCHSADAMRYFAMGYRETLDTKNFVKNRFANSEFSVFNHDREREADAEFSVFDYAR